MNDTITIKLTRAEKAAAKRLVRYWKWRTSMTYHGPGPYDNSRSNATVVDDTDMLASAVLDAIKKGGAK